MIKTILDFIAGFVFGACAASAFIGLCSIVFLEPLALFGPVIVALFAWAVCWIDNAWWRR